MNFTYYGHSCFSVTVGEHTVLFDPFITPNPAAKNVDITSLNPDYICISHGHADHIADAEAIARQSDATIISNFEIYEWFSAKGLEKLQPLNHGGTISLPFGTLKYVNAIHSSKLPDGSDGGNAGGFLLESPEGSFYYAGDTALTYDMKMIGEFHNIDWAILPIGDVFTMGVEDATICAQWVNAKNVIGVHFDTFEPIAINHEEVRKKFQQKNLKLILPEILQTLPL